jgi:hypothetical protein
MLEPEQITFVRGRIGRGVRHNGERNIFFVEVDGKEVFHSLSSYECHKYQESVIDEWEKERLDELAAEYEYQRRIEGECYQNSGDTCRMS